MNVAIIGARGIGKHHAKWFHLEGCHVAAFAGTSPETCQQAEAALRGLFDFQGRSYTDYRRMLDAETLDIVSICSPPDCHHAQAVAALQAGAHVYCEKPFIWPSFDAQSYPLPSLSAADRASATVHHPMLRRTVDEAREVVSLAERRQRVFGLNAQYVAAHASYQAMYEAARGPLRDIDTVYFLLESKGISGRMSSYEGIFIDMASHALSQVIAWLPDGTLDPESVECRITQNETVARFRYGPATVETVLRKNPAAQRPQRQFGTNQFIVEYEARADEQGVFRAVLRHGDQTVTSEDLVQLSVRRFLDVIRRGEGRPFVDGRDAVTNIELEALIVERGQREG